jgi:hypothetical protein
MAKDDASGRPGNENESIENRPQDDLVARIRPDPTGPPTRTLTLTGLLGDSDRPGHRRLYFNSSLDYYAEFRTDDVISTADVPADAPPFVGEPATKVTLARDAVVSYTHTRQATAIDEFDLDLRLGAPTATAIGLPQAETWEAECPGPTWGDCPTFVFCGTNNDCPTGFTVCKPRTCNVDICFPETKVTCNQATCQTCQTKCGQATCGTCAGQATCGTCAGQATCATCAGHATCATCEGATCDTCVTCRRCITDNPHVFTCGGGRQCL